MVVLGELNVFSGGTGLKSLRTTELESYPNATNPLTFQPPFLFVFVCDGAEAHNLEELWSPSVGRAGNGDNTFCLTVT